MSLRLSENFLVMDMLEIPPAQRHKLEKALEELGYDVDGGGTNLEDHRSEIFINRPFPFVCLCCGATITGEQWQYSNGVCGYCDTGRCMHWDLSYEPGHGRVVRLVRG